MTGSLHSNSRGGDNDRVFIFQLQIGSFRLRSTTGFSTVCESRFVERSETAQQETQIIDNQLLIKKQTSYFRGLLISLDEIASFHFIGFCLET